MCKIEYAEGGAKLHQPAQDRVKDLLIRKKKGFLKRILTNLTKPKLN